MSGVNEVKVGGKNLRVLVVDSTPLTGGLDCRRLEARSKTVGNQRNRKLCSC